MLPKLNRLHEEKEILKSLRSRYFSATKNLKLVLSRSSEKNFRACFIVGKKVFKKANKRHRLKRRVISIIEKFLIEKKITLRYFNCVIICQSKDVLTFKSDNLEAEILNLFINAKSKIPFNNKPKIDNSLKMPD